MGQIRTMLHEDLEDLFACKEVGDRRDLNPQPPGPQPGAPPIELRPPIQTVE